MRLEPIQYLRWARSPAIEAGCDVGLHRSGMSAPSAELLTNPRAQEALVFDDRDLPDLACRMAADLGCPSEEIWLQPGTHGALFALLAARLADRPGPVLVEEPAYEPLRRIPAFLGAELLRLPRPRSRGFQPDWAALEAAGRRSPSVLLLSHPHNPSGALLDAGARERLVAWARERDCAIVSDEVYLEFAAEPRKQTLRATSAQVMTVGSFTKVMGLGALRVTFCIGPTRWIERAAEFSDYGPIAVSGPSQLLGAAAWRRREELYARARNAAADGRELVAEWLARHEGEIEALLPAVGIICFPRLLPHLHERMTAFAAAQVAEPHGYGLDAHPGGSHEWLRMLAREHGVLLTPGAFFEDPMAFRLGFGIPEDRLREGLTRLDRFLARAKESA